MLLLLAAFVVSLSATLWLVHQAKSGAQRMQDHDLSGPQKFHASPVPRVGGIGITLGVAPAFTQMDYDAPLLAFGKIRHDRQLTGQISLLDRRLSYHGMTPRISYTYTRADSDIALYSFNRHHFEIGITKTF